MQSYLLVLRIDQRLEMIILAQKTFGVFLCVLMMFTEVSCLQHSYELKLSGPVTIGDQWAEFQPKPQLKAEKDYQWVRLDLVLPLRDDLYNEGKGSNKGKGILMPDGEVVNPEIELIDEHGRVYKLVYHGSRRGGPIYGHPDTNALPRDREYKMVRIRSPRPIKCKAVYWFCESSKDWK